MLQAEISRSALEDTRLLWEGGDIDRTATLPLALVVVRNALGSVALVGRRGTQGRMFPIGKDELPVVRDLQKDVVSRYLLTFLEPPIVALRPPPEELPVLLIRGLRAPKGLAPTILAGDIAPDDPARRIGILPFLVDVQGTPQLRDGASWHTRKEAERQVGNLASATDQAIGQAILVRVKSAPPPTP